jgi:uncharacterized protein (TIGR02217 family)
MPALAGFHEIRFPTGIALGATGGPERRTEIVTLSTGHEERNSRWADSRRRYNAGYGIRALDDIHAVIAFFEERRGRLYGFRWRDALDWKSCAPGGTPSSLDQAIGEGDGEATTFRLTKTYGSVHAPYRRDIRKPVAGSVRMAVGGIEIEEGSGWSCDLTEGLIVFAEAPAEGASITAGFEFDVPVRFDTDRLEINLRAFQAGEIPSIPLTEIRL